MVRYYACLVSERLAADCTATRCTTPRRRFGWFGVSLLVLVGVWLVSEGRVGAAGRQGAPTAGFDRILDQYVRDGFVYYAALKIERRAIDEVIASLAAKPPAFDAWSEPRRLAYWINGYNALVLRSVIDAYPIRGTSA